MPDNPEIPETESIGAQFRACPKCGELSSSPASFCKFCGSPLDAAISQSERALAQVPVETYSVVDVAHAGDERNSEVPTEYYAGFHPECFSWPAFWFADLWHAEKGLPKIARHHFLPRILAYFSGTASLILLVYWASESSGGSSNPGVGFAVLALTLIWLGLSGVNFLMSYVDASVAHKRYCDLLNSMTEPEHAVAMSRGESAYWLMLFIPFALFLAAFGIMLLSVRS
jgi:hypothetical protein